MKRLTCFDHFVSLHQVDDYHGNKICDPYIWLEDPDSAETVVWFIFQSIFIIKCHTFCVLIRSCLFRCVSGLRWGAEQADSPVPGAVCHPRSVPRASHQPLWLSKIQLPLQKRKEVLVKFKDASYNCPQPDLPLIGIKNACFHMIFYFHL